MVQSPKPAPPASPYGLIPQQPAVPASSLTLHAPPANRQPAPINLDATTSTKPATPAPMVDPLPLGTQGVVPTPAIPTSAPIVREPQGLPPSFTPLPEPVTPIPPLLPSTPSPTAIPPMTMAAPSAQPSAGPIIMPLPGATQKPQQVAIDIPMLSAPSTLQMAVGKGGPNILQPVALGQPSGDGSQHPMDAAIFRTLELRSVLKSGLQPSSREDAAEALANGPFARYTEIRMSLTMAAVEDPCADGPGCLYSLPVETGPPRP